MNADNELRNAMIEANPVCRPVLRILTMLGALGIIMAGICVLGINSDTVTEAANDVCNTARDAGYVMLGLGSFVFTVGIVETFLEYSDKEKKILGYEKLAENDDSNTSRHKKSADWFASDSKTDDSQQRMRDFNPKDKLSWQERDGCDGQKQKAYGWAFFGGGMLAYVIALIISFNFGAVEGGMPVFTILVGAVGTISMILSLVHFSKLIAVNVELKEMDKVELKHTEDTKSKMKDRIRTIESECEKAQGALAEANHHVYGGWKLVEQQNRKIHGLEQEIEVLRLQQTPHVNANGPEPELPESAPESAPGHELSMTHTPYSCRKTHLDDKGRLFGRRLTSNPLSSLLKEISA